MENLNISDFEKQWDKFIIKFKGKLLSESKKQALSYPFVNILLRDARLCWESKYDENGRWLDEYKKSFPVKGERIYNILLNLSLTEIKSAKDISGFVEYGVPVAGAVAGLGISSILGAELLVKAVSTAVPALLLYTSIKTVKSNRKSNMDRDSIGKYIEQLETYKNNIILIISE